MYYCVIHETFIYSYYMCLHGMGPIYLSEMCRPSSSEAGRRHLRSANRGQLVVPRYRLTTADISAFSCTGPSAWNSLSEYLTVDTLTLDYFKRSLICFLFARYWHSAWSALGIFVMIVRYINVHLNDWNEKTNVLKRCCIWACVKICSYFTRITFCCVVFG